MGTPKKAANGPELPWDASTGKGIKVDKYEPKAARYLGYKDLGQFRRWQCSHVFLDVFFAWQKAIAAKSFRASQVFSKIMSAKRDGKLEEKYGGTLGDLHKRYPVSGAGDLDDEVQKQNRQEHLTGLLYQLVHQQVDFNVDEQMSLETKSFDNRPDKKTLPEIRHPPQTPSWGPHEQFGEEHGECYNRALPSPRSEPLLGPVHHS